MKTAPRTSAFCTPTRAVIQLVPGNPAGQINYAGRSCRRIEAWMILPGERGTIASPLNYFQRRASLPEGWIAAEDGEPIPLWNVAGLEAVAVTVVEEGGERECGLPEFETAALLRYFMMDIPRHEPSYVGFDCYAFVSCLSNALYRPEDPPFAFEDGVPQAGDRIVVASGAHLPGAIRHWALCVGPDIFISKFGKTGDGAQALLEATDMQAMLSLYDGDRALIARKRAEAPPWDDWRWPIPASDPQSWRLNP
jgi:hypothetical protein